MAWTAFSAASLIFMVMEGPASLEALLKRAIRRRGEAFSECEVGLYPPILSGLRALGNNPCQLRSVLIGRQLKLYPKIAVAAVNLASQTCASAADAAKLLEVLTE